MSDTTMLAVTVEGGPRAVEVALPPPPAPGEVLVRVDRVGLCGTDLELFEGYGGHRGVIGHEFAGTVVDADLYAWMRRRVTAHINIPPAPRGQVDWRAAKHDPERSALGIRGRNGVMAEFALLPEGVLVVLPDSVSDAAGAMAEPLAAAMDAVERAGDAEGPVLLAGDGRLAQLAARVLRFQGREVHAFGHHDARLKMLEQAGVKVLDGPPRSGGYRRVIEATGSGDGAREALAATAPEGTLVVQSTFGGPVELELARIVVDEIRLVGSRCGDVAAAVDLLAEGAVQVEDLVTDVFPLREAQRAFQRMREPDAIKVQLTPGS